MRIAKIKWAMPHCYALIFFIIILVALLTWCIPSGSFDYHSVTLPGGETKTLVIPGSYHLLDKVSSEGDLRQGITAVLAAPMEGIIKAADVVAFVLIVGGAFGIILRTGAIERGLVALAERLAGKGILVIPIAITLFSLGGATFGMSEEVIPLYAIFISLMFALGYDSMTAILILFLGTQIGYVGAMTNPFSVLIAQGVAGIQEIRSFGYVLLHGWSSRYWRLLTPCGTRTVLNALRKSRRYMKMIVATASSFCRYRIRRSIFPSPIG